MKLLKPIILKYIAAQRHTFSTGNVLKYGNTFFETKQLFIFSETITYLTNVSI